MTRLTHLRAELELLERLNTLQGLVSAGDEAAKRELDLTIKNTLNKLLVQYNTLSEIAPSKMAPSTVGGAEQPAPRQLSFLRRALLLYDPDTALGWILHTVFYVVSIIFAVLSFFYSWAAPLKKATLQETLQRGRFLPLRLSLCSWSFDTLADATPLLS